MLCSRGNGDSIALGRCRMPHSIGRGMGHSRAYPKRTGLADPFGQMEELGCAIEPTPKPANAPFDHFSHFATRLWFEQPSGNPRIESHSGWRPASTAIGRVNSSRRFMDSLTQELGVGCRRSRSGLGSRINLATGRHVWVCALFGRCRNASFVVTAGVNACRVDRCVERACRGAQCKFLQGWIDDWHQSSGCIDSKILARAGLECNVLPCREFDVHWHRMEQGERANECPIRRGLFKCRKVHSRTVSYTHLTLPTICSV